MTPKQQRFVQEYLIDLNATQAAIRAGYSKHTANEQGSQLLAKLNIREAVAAGQVKIAAAAAFTAEDILRDLEEARTGAVNAGQYSAAIRAVELRGKQIGMFVDRVMVKNIQYVVQAPLQAESPEQWLATYAVAPVARLN